MPLASVCSVAVATTAPLASRVSASTAAPAGSPVATSKTGRTSLVRLSPSVPVVPAPNESDVASRSGVAAGGVASNVKSPETVAVLPALSIAVATTSYRPSTVSAVVIGKVQTPSASATTVTVSTGPWLGSVTVTVTAAPGSAVPLSVGVGSLVRRSAAVPVVSGPKVSSARPV